MHEPQRNKSNRFLVSLHAALQGILHAAKTERNFRIHLAISVAVIAIGFGLRLNPLEWALIVFAIGFVLHAELFNTAIEAIVDRVSPELHPLARIAKDTAAAAVVVSVTTAVTIGLVLLLPKLLKLVMEGF